MQSTKPFTDLPVGTYHITRNDEAVISPGVHGLPLMTGPIDTFAVAQQVSSTLLNRSAPTPLTYFIDMDIVVHQRTRHHQAFEHSQQLR